MPIEKFTETSTGLTATTLVQDELEMLYTQVHTPEGQLPFFQAEWPIRVGFQQALTFIRGSYWRLDSEFKKSPQTPVFSSIPAYSGDIPGFAQVMIDEYPITIGLQEFLAPSPFINERTADNTNSLMVATPYLDYAIEENGGMFRVLGLVNLTDEILQLMVSTSNRSLPYPERGNVMKALNEMYGGLPGLSPRPGYG